jgi:Undecaprenyl-phosphate galactose phosphotransferase WbaP
LTVLKSQQVLEDLALTQSGVLASDRPRSSPISCTVSLFAADSIAIILSVIVVACCGAFLSSALAMQAQPDGVWALRDVLILYVVTTGYLAFKGRYSERIPFWTEMKLILSTTFWAISAEVVLGALDRDIISRAPTIVIFGLFPVFAIVANALAKSALTQTGAWTLSIVLIGDGAGALAAEAALASDPGLGYEVVGRVDPAAVMAVTNGPKLWPLVERFRADRLLLALDGDKEMQRQVIGCALRERVPFAIAPEPHAFPAFAWEATRFFSHDAVMLSVRHGLSRRLSQAVKATIDVSAAAVLLLLASPVFLLVILLNKLDGGPIFFAHRRLGAGGRSFPCLKFRTMVVDGERVLAEALAADPVMAAEWEATRKLRNDPRVTRIGKFLRKTSLDELPQLINVLLRQMSLVGPRPIVESEARFYGDDIAHYYGTRPGLTGLWQVSGRSNTSYARRVQLDVWYVNNWTVWLDIAVLLKTLPAVLGRNGAH